ncbi:FeS cluster assembly protein SufB [Nymphon striatum]|nr:FeS cluster assembly protein SufB [Nymphon striatum]
MVRKASFIQSRFPMVLSRSIPVPKCFTLAKTPRAELSQKVFQAGKSQNTYRGQVSAHKRASDARNFTQCDSLLIGDKCGAHTVPYIEAKNSTAQFEHEATTSKISDDQLFYCMQRGIPEEEAIALIVNGFVKEVIQELPMEFAVEAQKLISISLEGSSVRLIVFLWLIIFPIIFIALPVLEMVTGERENDLTPLWAFGVWILGPWAGSIIWKWFGGEN